MTDPIEILMQEHKDVLEIVDNIGRLQQELKDTPDETAPKLKELLAKLDKEFDIHSLSKERAKRHCVWLCIVQWPVIFSQL